jgi:iron(III) transport system substrate-binding protein
MTIVNRRAAGQGGAFVQRPCVGWIGVLALSLSIAGCWTSSSGPELVVYSALDKEFAEPILESYGGVTGVTVLPKFDIESTKTVGLAEAIIQEKSRPRCDVFWNNEILHTLRLEKLGLLDPYQPTNAGDYPANMQSPVHTWHGFAARARVLIVNTNLVPEEKRPDSVLDLIDPEWKGRVGIAKPLFGTAATHAAVLFSKWGDDEAKKFFADVKENCKIEAGNKQVARDVASGALAWGVTDTDDAIGELESGMPVAIIYPDQAPDQMGTLFIPNTVAIIKGCPHPMEARRFVDSLLTPQIETQLAKSASAQIPLNKKVKDKLRTESPKTIRAMEVDFQAASEKWDVVASYLKELM